MNRDQITIEYDEFFPKPTKERIEIFNEISAENRAFLVKTHAERWLAANRSRLDHEQIAVVEQMIRSVSPQWYKKRRDFEQIDPKAELLIKKLEAVLSREDLAELATRRSEYIPAVKDENG